MKAKELLKQRYITQLKKNPKAYIGVELEFPIVNLTGQATDISVCQGLLAYLANKEAFQVEKCDSKGNPIQLWHKSSGDRLLFEVSYTTLEFAFEKAETIQDVDDRFKAYLEEIQAYLGNHQHALQGKGIHPAWDKNSNAPVQTPRYEMLIAYLGLSKKQASPYFHQFPQYGAFICGNQVQLDVSKDNYLRVINAFNRIEAAKAYLFANSEFEGRHWDTKVARDIFWERSMHGYYDENIGIYPRDFMSEDEFLTVLADSSLFTTQRNGEILYFSPIRARDYLAMSEITAYNLAGEKKIIQPEEADFDYHRSYHYQDLTKRGTVEFRSVCTQPLAKTFAPIAFHVGLMANLETLEAYLNQQPIFEIYHYDYKGMRRLFSGKSLTSEQEKEIRAFSRDLLTLAYQGLEKRGFHEEVYLETIDI